MQQVSEQRNGRVRSFGMKLDGLIRTSLMAHYISTYNRRHLSDVSCHHSRHWSDVSCHSRHWSDTMCKAQVTAAQWLGEKLSNEARLVDQDIFPGMPQSLSVGC